MYVIGSISDCILADKLFPIDYGPAYLTMLSTPPPPPPTPLRSRVSSFFSHRRLVQQINFPREKVDFVRDIRIRVRKNVVLRHNHSIPTKLTLFDYIE